MTPSARLAFHRLAPPALYAALSFVYFGWRLVPHPGRLLVGAHGESDAEIFVWSFAWWPHAIGDWTNPFVSHAVYAPTGVNLESVTSVPGLALAFSPITLLFGPSVAYNLAAVLLPALSAWTAFLLCRAVTRSVPAALAGGYLYGFSSYELAHQYAGHLNLTAVFLVPLLALAVLRYVRGELDGRGLAWRAALIVAFQFSISTEVSLTLALALLLGLVLGLALLPASRARIRAAVLPLAAAYALAAVLAAPLVYYAVTGIVPGANAFAGTFGADLLNLVVPTRATGIAGSWLDPFSSRFRGDTAERDSYLGLPTLAIVALLLLRRPLPRSTLLLAAGLALATLLSFGTALEVAGRRVVPLPWSALAGWTGVEQVIPSRLALYGTLAAAVLVALWLAAARGRRGAALLAGLAVVALVPPLWGRSYVDHPVRWAFFSDGLYRLCVPRGETLMVFPFGHWGGSLLWQAEAGFWFALPEGTLAHNDQPAPYAADPTAHALIFDYPDVRPSMADLHGLARRRHVDRIASVAQDDPYPDGGELEAFGPVQVLGDVAVAPACGHPSLTGDRRRP
jgi:hypothetical protein